MLTVRSRLAHSTLTVISRYAHSPLSVSSKSTVGSLTFLITVRSHSALGTLSFRSQYAHCPLIVRSQSDYDNFTVRLCYGNGTSTDGENILCLYFGCVCSWPCPVLNVTTSVDIPVQTHRRILDRLLTGTWLSVWYESVCCCVWNFHHYFEGDFCSMFGCSIFRCHRICSTLWLRILPSALFFLIYNCKWTPFAI
jgi:hypothetical protein